MIILGVRKLTGENLKAVWAEFSTLSHAVSLCMQLHDMPKPRLENSAQVGSEKANGREPKSCLGRVFNFKLGHFVLYAIAQHIQKHALA